MVFYIKGTRRCSLGYSRNVWLETIIVGYHTCTVPDLCVSSSCVSWSRVCVVVFVVMRLVVWLAVWLAV